MTPKETVQSAFETAITPVLDREGFTYSRSQFAFKRKVDEFVQHISIMLSHHNTQDTIQFWSAFNVTSPQYKRWRTEQGREKFDGFMGGCMDWNIPRWREPDDYSTSWDFSDPASRIVTSDLYLSSGPKCPFEAILSPAFWAFLETLRAASPTLIV